MRPSWIPHRPCSVSASITRQRERQGKPRPEHSALCGWPAQRNVNRWLGPKAPVGVRAIRGQGTTEYISPRTSPAHVHTHVALIPTLPYVRHKPATASRLRHQLISNDTSNMKSVSADTTETSRVSSDRRISATRHAGVASCRRLHDTSRRCRVMITLGCDSHSSVMMSLIGEQRKVTQ